MQNQLFNNSVRFKELLIAINAAFCKLLNRYDALDFKINQYYQINENRSIIYENHQ